MVVSMRTSGLAANSISSYVRVFKAFLSWCNEKNMQRMLDETREIYSAEREEKYGALGIRCELL